MVTVRPARPDDATAIREVAREAWHAAYDDLLGPDAVDERVDAWYDPDRIRESISSPGSFSVAVDDGTVVGFVHLAPPGPEAPSVLRDPGAAVLFRLYVRPGRWDEGIGSALLDAAERRVDERFDRVRCVVYADNDRARSFFASRGFEERERLQADPPEIVLEGPLGDNR